MAQPVNIKVYTFCYNSEKILPFIINYWKQYATSVVVYDNMSTDKSVEILSKYDWIEVRHFDTNKKHDPDKMMQIKNNCVNESKSSKADYVMICDLDEVLYCYDSLMHDLAIAKQNGIKVFNSVYYNAIVNKFPASSQTLLQNISGVKLVKNINVNKVLLFDPSINIKFSNLQNNCTYDNNIKTGEINIIHNKMIGLDRFLNEQLDYIKRINKTNKYAMTYGASKNSCVAIFNNIYAKSFQPLYKAINQRIILNNCKLPVQKTESKQVQTSNIIPETKNSTFNFTDIKWKPAKIQYNTPACGNKDLVIVIPVYKADLDKYEQMSLQRLSQVIKTSFDIVLVMPEGLNIESYNNIYPGKINTLALNKQYFCNRKGYSYLCETTQFYECFSDYKFMLIYQLDGWIFKNDLNRFIKMDYDYIGAPWKQSLAIPRTVGNGGVSLRKISKFIEICKWLDPKDINEKYAAQIEDIFFCLYVKKKLKDKFNIAPVNVGLDFCIDKNPTYWMSESKGKLPMCVHAFQKHYSYWEDKIAVVDKPNNIQKSEIKKNIEVNKEEKTAIKTMNNYSIKSQVKKDDTIIVSMTSWTKRINKVINVLRLMDMQTLMPDKIILNLSTDEFNNKEKDLPSDLVNYIKEHKNTELYWVKENTKPYKKLIPTLKRYPDAVIITIDDDITYPQNFIEILYKKYIDYNKQCPITSGTYQWDNGIYTHYGCFSLVTSKLFGKYIWELYDNVYQKNKDICQFSDVLFTYAMLLNGKQYKFTEELNMSAVRVKDGQDDVSLSTLGNKTYKANIKKEHDFIRKYIKEHYNKTYDDLFKKDIIVNFTTWHKRDWCVPIMIKEFKKQTIKPNKIFCWLSREEYDINNLPIHLQQGVENGDFEIKWVDKNTYCHKRHDVFKEYNDCYNIFIDDDNIYPPTLLEELYNTSIKHQNTIISYIGYTQEYKGTNRIMNAYQPKLGNSYKHTFLGNGVIFPPYIFPLASFKYANVRDKIVPVCDESWLVPWFIKEGVTFNVLHNRKLISDFKHFPDSQAEDVAVYKDMKKTDNVGVRNKEKYFSNVIKFLHIENKIKTIWPAFDIDKCYDKKLFETL